MTSKRSVPVALALTALLCVCHSGTARNVEERNKEIPLRSENTKLNTNSRVDPRQFTLSPSQAHTFANDSGIGPRQFTLSPSQAHTYANDSGIGPRQFTLSPSQAHTFANDSGIGPRQFTLSPSQAHTYANDSGIGPRQFTLSPSQAHTYANDSGVGPRQFTKSPNQTIIEPRIDGSLHAMSRDGLNCGVRYIAPGSTSLFQSIGYPGNYRNRYRCMWRFWTLVESSLSIECDDFLLESSRRCRNDFLRIWGSGINRKFCGSRASLAVSVEGRSLRAFFKTNRKNVQRGFNCYVTASGQ
ncbi:astacin-like metalloendopeptidase [Penaeus indicus]|uniref:astacin-like metalloendopeptidase n=1 Tax=Penaeus indicus TaxID=29960 RepID=UPI00300C5C7E